MASNSYEVSENLSEILSSFICLSYKLIISRQASFRDACLSVYRYVTGTLTLTVDIWTYSLRKYTVFGPELDMFTALILRDSSVLFHGRI